MEFPPEIETPGSKNRRNGQHKHTTEKEDDRALYKAAEAAEARLGSSSHSDVVSGE